uniref:Uncharacterized protein n=1 Tax=Lactuca sativa TaxID=4236 RepID=A0A9R1WMD8_LACSA|nr:hypothetical protein LSAT_V11C100019170 [Lactuca sativa]
MQWKSPADAMPWVGLYVCLASLVCTLAMAADAFQGFWQWKIWFPCRFFTINAASITLIAIAIKLPVDLDTDMSDAVYMIAKSASMIFLETMVANFLPSLGLIDDKELLMNMLAFGILIITSSVNVWIQFSTIGPFTTPIQLVILILPLPWPFSVAMIVPASRRSLQHHYEKLHGLASDPQEINFSSKRLIRYVKEYWMMAEIGNPQFVIACSPVCSAFGVICILLACVSCFILVTLFNDLSNFQYGNSDYKWSINVIVTLQLIGAIIGSIAPIFRCLTAISHFNLSIKWTKNHINVFRVEKQWIERLQLWKHSHVNSHIVGRHCTKVFRHCTKYFCKSLLKRFKEEPNVSNGNVILDVEENSAYVIQIEADTKLSKRILRRTLNSIIQLLHEAEEKEPRNLTKLLKKSTGFYGVVEFDNDQVPRLHQEEMQNCWSLVTVTLTAIALALPKIAKCHVKGLLAGMREGLEFVTHIEESLNENGGCVKAARRVWTDVEPTIIADPLCACFTNLPRVITMKYHEDAIEKKEESIRIAAKLLGRSRKILKILKGLQLPNIDVDSMGYIDKWHTLRMSHIPNGSIRFQPASSSSNESLVLTII